MRSHIAWYIKGMPDCVLVKNECFKATSASEIKNILSDFVRLQEKNIDDLKKYL